MSFLGIFRVEVAEGQRGMGKDAKEENSSSYSPWGSMLGRFKKSSQKGLEGGG